MIAWPWFWVLSPVWIPLGVVLIIGAFALTLAMWTGQLQIGGKKNVQDQEMTHKEYEMIDEENKELLEKSKKTLHHLIDELEKLPDKERSRVMRTLVTWYQHDKRRAMREAAQT